MNEIQAVQAAQIKANPDVFNIGDTVKVHFAIVEAGKERIQVYEGLVIAMKNGNASRTFTVRKNS
jgi:large subunit ribosomal protein L19